LFKALKELKPIKVEPEEKYYGTNDLRLKLYESDTGLKTILDSSNDLAKAMEKVKITSKPINHKGKTVRAYIIPDKVLEDLNDKYQVTDEQEIDHLPVQDIRVWSCIKSAIA
jgi:hypothetical protein